MTIIPCFMKKLILTLVVVLISIAKTYSQTPLDDSTWTKHAFINDEFNYNMDGTKTGAQQLSYFNNTGAGFSNYNMRQGDRDDAFQWKKYKESARTLNAFQTKDTHNMTIKNGILTLKQFVSQGLVLEKFIMIL